MIRNASERLLTLVVLLVFAPVSQGGFLYDLKSDWSNSTNPNGAWRYQQGNSLNSYNANWPGDAWGVAQNAWSGSFPQVWFQSNGTELFSHDWSAGDIITHSGNLSTFGSSSVVTWTSVSAGIVDISGEIWKTRDIGRSNDWSLFLNNTMLTSGTVASGGVYTSVNPFEFLNGSGGAGVLQNVGVAIGDVISLRVMKSASSLHGDYAGVNLSIDFNSSAVPEPGSFTLFLLVAASAVWTGLVRRRRFVT